MNLHFPAFLVAIVFSFLAFGGAKAEDKGGLSVLKDIGYEATGESKRCVTHSRIRRTEVIDNFTILFHMMGRKSYANILDRECPRLHLDRAIKYEVRGGTLCNVDSIEVIDVTTFPNMGFSGSHCSLGDFHEIIKTQAGSPDNAEITPTLKDSTQ